MAKPIKNEENRLIGVWPHTAGWEICRYEEGKKVSEYRKSETLAKQRGEYWKARFNNSMSRNESTSTTHPVIFWEQKLREAAEYILSNPGDETAIDTGKVLASMATAGLRAAAFYPPPALEVDGEKQISDDDISKMSTEELLKLANDKS